MLAQTVLVRPGALQRTPTKAWHQRGSRNPGVVATPFVLSLACPSYRTCHVSHDGFRTIDFLVEKVISLVLSVYHMSSQLTASGIFNWLALKPQTSSRRFPLTLLKTFLSDWLSRLMKG